MNIDWFTFVAQIVNFLVLVALLRWLLYDPIVRAMDQREAKITSRLEEADQQRKAAEEKAQSFEAKQRELERQREELLEQARHEGQEELQRLLQEARAQVDRQRREWQEALHREQEDLLAELRRQAGEMGLRAARHTLSQLAGAELEQRMCDLFGARLHDLDDQQRQEMFRDKVSSDTMVAIRSAFDLPELQRERLRDTVRDTLDANVDVSFERSTDLICGLELDVDGYSFGWNVADFLQDLDLQFAERLAAWERQPAQPNHEHHDE